jgi:hypothetical protein
MEELADAIEDAQYVNAIATQDDGPRPVLRWEKPTEVELEAWEKAIWSRYTASTSTASTCLTNNSTESDSHNNNNNNNNDPAAAAASFSSPAVPFSLEWTCQQQIGYFLFSQYVKQVHGDYPRMNFSEDVCRFLRLPANSQAARFLLAVQMTRHYLGLDQARVVVEQRNSSSKPMSITITSSSSSTAAGGSNGCCECEQPDESTKNKNAAIGEQPAAAASTSNDVVDASKESCTNSARAAPVYYSWPMPPRSEINEYSLARPIRWPAKYQVDSGASDNAPHHSGPSFDRRQSVDSLLMTRTQQANRMTVASNTAFPHVTSHPTGSSTKNSASEVSQMTRQELQAMFDLCHDYPYCSESVVGVRGPILQEIQTAIQTVAATMVKQRPQKKKEGSSSNSFSCLLRDGSSSSLHLPVVPIMPPVPERKTTTTTTTSNTGNGAAAAGSVEKESAHTPESPNDNETTTTSQTRGLRTGLSRSAVVPGSQQYPSTVHEPYLPTDMFDKAEYVVMESLRRQYWDGFVQSSYFTKMKHFLWYQDRKVQADDFFIMRVLGRGGFGLVTGTCCVVGGLCGWYESVHF